MTIIINQFNRYFRGPCIFWVIWMLSGTLYYSIGDKFGWQLGFYLAVNVGYAIGWGYPLDPSKESQWFSSFFVIIGSALGAYGSYQKSQTPKTTA